jgi:Fic family protein
LSTREPDTAGNVGGRGLPLEEIFAVDAASRASASAAVQRGTLRRIVRGVYTRDLATPLEALVRTRLLEVVAAVRPGALIADRSATLGGRPTADNLLFLVHPKQQDVVLPGGLVLRSRRGVGPLPSDLELPHGLRMSSQARTALENMVASRSRGGRSSRTLSPRELEQWLDRQAGTQGDDWARALRDEVRALAPQLGLEREAEALDRILGALLGTRTVAAASPELAARLRGVPFDAARVALCDRLLTYLSTTAPPPARLSDRGPRENVLPFVEAYFSNFIEGTEFAFGEAAAIVYDGQEPVARPADAHDVRGTFQLAADDAEMQRTPASAADLAELLRHRHAILMAGRPDTRPGQFKDVANRAGSTHFVAPRLVEGMLAAGFERYAQLRDPFARAAFVMFLVSEVHPFDDGNGRVARLMMNAELVAAGQVRIVIPTVYRTNYLMALRGLTQNANAESYAAMLDFAQRYTAQLDCTTLETAERTLTATNAFVDATEADQRGIRLTLPGALPPAP